jgi:hypothetical protein
MVRIAVQASSGAARFSVAVQAESIERALEIAKQDLGRNSEATFPVNSWDARRCGVRFGQTPEIGAETGR